MKVVITVPDKLAEVLTEREDLSRQMLEAFAIESYRQEKLSLGQVAELLNFSIDETNAFLKKHRVPTGYTFEDMKQDQAAIEIFLRK